MIGDTFHVQTEIDRGPFGLFARMTLRLNHARMWTCVMPLEPDGSLSPATLADALRGLANEVRAAPP